MTKSKAFLKNTVVVVFWLLVWQVLASLANRNLIIPIPTFFDTVKTLFLIGGTKEFLLSALMSFLRIGAGFVLAVAAGCVCAVLSAYIPPFRALFEPLLKIIRAVPVASFIMLVFLWLERGTIPTFISFLTVLPIVWANVLEGISKTDKKLIEMASVMGLKKPRIIKKIVIGGVKPYFTTAAATGLGFAWKSGAAAEVICRTGNSLGEILWRGKSDVNYNEVFAVTAVIIILSILLENGIRLILERGNSHD